MLRTWRSICTPRLAHMDGIDSTPAVAVTVAVLTIVFSIILWQRSRASKGDTLKSAPGPQESNNDHKEAGFSSAQASNHAPVANLSTEGQEVHNDRDKSSPQETEPCKSADQEPEASSNLIKEVENNEGLNPTQQNEPFSSAIQEVQNDAELNPVQHSEPSCAQEAEVCISALQEAEDVPQCTRELHIDEEPAELQEPEPCKGAPQVSADVLSSEAPPNVNSATPELAKDTEISGTGICQSNSENVDLESTTCESTPVQTTPLATCDATPKVTDKSDTIAAEFIKQPGATHGEYKALMTILDRISELQEGKRASETGGRGPWLDAASRRLPDGKNDVQCYPVIFRYIRGHLEDGGVERVWSKLCATAAWRERFDVDSVCNNFGVGSDLHGRIARKHWRAGQIGLTHSNSFTFFVWWAKTDMVGLMRELKSEVSLQLFVFLLEQALEKRPEGQGVLLMDLGAQSEGPGHSMKYLSKWISDLTSFVKALAPIFSEHYPETFSKLIFTRAPMMFWAPWGIIKMFLPPRTRNKVVIMTGKDTFNQLCQYMSPEVIPEELGGKNRTVATRCDGKDVILDSQERKTIGLQAVTLDGPCWEGVGCKLPSLQQ